MITLKIIWDKTTVKRPDETGVRDEITICGRNCTFYGVDEIHHWCKLDLSEPHDKGKPGETRKEAFLRTTYLNPQVPGPNCPGPAEYALEKIVRSPSDKQFLQIPDMRKFEG
jgi:hypothetical protein